MVPLTAIAPKAMAALSASHAPDLSVVLIARNQAWNLARLIESVVVGTAGLRGVEILLVDADSDDGTVDLARRYPVTILRVRAARFRTPSAGRAAGYARSTGALVLFLDGDMQLCPGWLADACAVMATSPGVAAVTGVIVNRPETAAAGDPKSWPATAPGAASAREVTSADGAGLYRRAVLDEVGSFTPFLFSEEEPELGIRIRRAGYRIIQIDRPIVLHYTDSLGTLPSLHRRWQRRLYFGAGQILRARAGSPVFWHYLRERGFAAAPLMALLVLGVGSAVSMRTHAARWLVAAVMSVLAAIGGAAWRRRLRPYQVAYSVAHRFYVLLGTVVGLCLPPPDPREPVATVELVREVGPRVASREGGA